MKHLLTLLGTAAALLGAASAAESVSFLTKRDLALALTFHAPFDGSPDATYALGDPKIQWGPKWGPPRTVQAGLPAGGAVQIAFMQGKYRDALRFNRKIDELIAFKAAKNVPYRDRDWSGTVSFWLRVNPDEDLEPGYCDTIQITSKEWNNAAFFTEFTKDEKPREFRLGAYADFPVWNPTNRKWEDMTLAEKPLVPVVKPPFSRDRWTHVAFTWENFNTGRPDGVTKLYLDGVLRGEISARPQTFTWKLDETFIMLGLSYTGWMDDLAVFNRALTLHEVTALKNLPKGVSSLHR